MYDIRRKAVTQVQTCSTLNSAKPSLQVTVYFGNRRRICYTFKSIYFLCSSTTHTDITSFHYIIFLTSQLQYAMPLLTNGVSPV